jgi:hypothetical protein
MLEFFDDDYFIEMAATYVLAAIGLVVLLRVLLRRAIVNHYDPLAIQIMLFLAPYTAGYILFPVQQQALTPTYWLILFFLATLVVVIWLFRVPRKAFTDVRLPPGFLQLVLMIVVGIDVANVGVNMLATGLVPLLSDAGSAGRFDATTNSRLLTWLYLGNLGTPGLIYALCSQGGIRRLALFAYGVELLTALLFASKAAVIQPLLLLLSCMFVASARGDNVSLRRYSRLLLLGGAALIVLLPAYLLAALRDTSASSLPLILGMRLFGGFDQLIPAALNDMMTDPSVPGDMSLNLLEYQLLPFFKLILGLTPTYSSIGQYVVAYWTGTIIDGPFTFPNSNLILETAFTSGNALGYLLYVLQLTIFYFARRMVLRRPITPVNLIIVKAVVFSPLGLFLSGQEFFVSISVCGVTFAIAYVLWSLRTKPRIAGQLLLVESSKPLQ